MSRAPGQQSAIPTAKTGQDRSLKVSVLHGVAWTALGFVGAQLMRLGSNLLMTRLLAPEHFGLMAIVLVVLVGLAMFSDIGLGPAIVRSRRYQDEDLLNTGWTLQIIRGAVMFTACCAAAVPLARFYGEPMLGSLLPVAGLSLLISGTAPMQVYTLQRDLALGRLVRIDLLSQAVSLLVMLVAAWFFRSIWVLVLGAVVGATTKTAGQWLALPVHRHRLALRRREVGELARFGGWVFASTVLTFAANSAGTLLLGKFAPLEKLGLFAIAATLAKAAELFYEQLSSRVLYPLYAGMPDGALSSHRPRILKLRLAIVAAFVPTMCAVAYFAEPVVHTLFDARYHDAAWMFQAALVGLVPSMICNTLPYLMARGSFAVSAAFQAARLLGCVSLLALGHRLGGVDGAILGLASVPSLLYLLDHWIQRRHGLADFRLDAAALSLWALTLGAIWHARG